MRRILSQCALIAAVAIAHGGAVLALRRFDRVAGASSPPLLEARLESGPGETPDEGPSATPLSKPSFSAASPSPMPRAERHETPNESMTESVETAAGVPASVSPAAFAPAAAGASDEASTDPSVATPGGMTGNGDPDSEPSTLSDYLANPAPVYPYASRLAGEEGEVRLKILVDSTGLPVKVELQRGSGHPHLDGAALTAVWKWSFRPARRSGRPTQGWIVVPLRFSLEGN